MKAPTHRQVVEQGLGELAGPHGSPHCTPPGTLIAVETGNRNRSLVRTDFYTLDPAEYRTWSDAQNLARFDEDGECAWDGVPPHCRQPLDSTGKPLRKGGTA